ncbi:unnamed protein product [Pylaiella littoralis]
MSQKSPSVPQRREYGATTTDDNAAAVKVGFASRIDKSGIWPSQNGNSTIFAGVQQQQLLGRRLRNLATVGALAIGATAVVDFAYNRRPSTSGASLVDDVAAPTAETSQSAPVRLRKSFPHPTDVTSLSRTPKAGEELAPLSFEATNFYHVRDGKPALDYPWLRDVKLIEPHRETTLSVSSPRDGYEYIWEVRGGDADTSDIRATASGAEAVVILSVLDDNIVTVKEVTPEGDVVRQLHEMVMVKYVRREIRTLTDEEREELLDAMYQLWAVRVDGGNGEELYGEDYADIYAISRLHFLAAMNKSCDHFHDGVGFVTNHSLISKTLSSTAYSESTASSLYRIGIGLSTGSKRRTLAMAMNL